MDAERERLIETVNRSYGGEGIASDLAEWFAVKGDADDFIFFDRDDGPEAEV
jgi:hypothetical protein